MYVKNAGHPRIMSAQSAAFMDIVRRVVSCIAFYRATIRSSGNATIQREATRTATVCGIADHVNGSEVASEPNRLHGNNPLQRAATAAAIAEGHGAGRIQACTPLWIKIMHDCVKLSG